VDAAQGVYATVKDCDPHGPLTATARAVMAGRSAMRERDCNRDAPEWKAACDATRGETLTWLGRENEGLRFTKAQRGPRKIQLGIR
jgi:hypothetical protein